MVVFSSSFLFCFVLRQFHHIAQAGLTLEILLHPTPKYYDYRPATPPGYDSFLIEQMLLIFLNP
jgi:hypothetical protein